MAEQEQKVVSDYNAAALINQRIQNSWTVIIKYRREGKFHLWNNELDSIWGELSGDLEEKKDYPEWEAKLKEYDGKLAKLGNIIDNFGFNNPTEEAKTNRILQYYILQEKHLFVKRLEKYLGKGTKFREGSDDYMSS